MGEVASVSLHAVLVLRVVLAEGRLVEIVQLLSALLGLRRLHDRNWYELGERVSCRMIAPWDQSCSDHGRYLMI